MSRYAWDREKSVVNLHKHGVAFEEAAAAASSPMALEEPDLTHAAAERRLKVIGWSPRGRLLMVVVSVSGPQPRIISARRATKRERDEYVG